MENEQHFSSFFYVNLYFVFFFLFINFNFVFIFGNYIFITFIQQFFFLYIQNDKISSFFTLYNMQDGVLTKLL